MPLARDVPQGHSEPRQKSLRAFRIAKGKHAALPFPPWLMAMARPFSRAIACYAFRSSLSSGSLKTFGNRKNVTSAQTPDTQPIKYRAGVMLPVTSMILPTITGLTMPPIWPAQLISAIPLAAAAPVTTFGGSDQNVV
jgi:hypothetical protein